MWSNRFTTEQPVVSARDGPGVRRNGSFNREPGMVADRLSRFDSLRQPSTWTTCRTPARPSRLAAIADRQNPNQRASLGAAPTASIAATPRTGA